jgi:hypothetical protein
MAVKKKNKKKMYVYRDKLVRERERETPLL